MIVNEDLLFCFGGALINFKKNDVIFEESEVPKFYYQIHSGAVKINNYNEEGREFIHSLPTSGHCLGETFLFSDRPYPVNAVAMKDTAIIRVSMLNFFKLVKTDIEILFNLYRYTSQRMHYRYMMLNNLSSNNPLTKVLGVINCLKQYHSIEEPFAYQIPYTRLEIASLTGLRVETVIRVFKKMEQANVVKIINSKIFY